MTILISPPDRLRPELAIGLTAFLQSDSLAMKANQQIHPEKRKKVSNQRDWKLWRPQRHRALLGGAAVLVILWIISLMTLILFQSSASSPGS